MISNKETVSARIEPIPYSSYFSYRFTLLRRLCFRLATMWRIVRVRRGAVADAKLAISRVVKTFQKGRSYFWLIDRVHNLNFRLKSLWHSRRFTSFLRQIKKHEFYSPVPSSGKRSAILRAWNSKFGSILRKATRTLTIDLKVTVPSTLVADQHPCNGSNLLASLWRHLSGQRSSLKWLPKKFIISFLWQGTRNLYLY